MATISDFVSSEFLCLSETEWTAAMKKDVVSRQVLDFLRKVWPNERVVSPEVAPFCHVSSEIEEVGGLLFKGGKIIPPVVMQNKILLLAHQGHTGMSSMKRLIRANFWWAGLDKFVDRIVRECSECISSDKMLHVSSAPLNPVAWPGCPWQKVAFDISGPFSHLPLNARYALVMVE